jgi:hypothetical protein
LTEWRAVKDYEGLYEVSNTGLVKALEKRVDRGKCHRTWLAHYKAYNKDANGYFRVSLSKSGVNKTHKVHRLVATAFIPNPDNLPCVNHIDGDKTNNKISNLEWCTHSENLKHACTMGLKSNAGENNSQSKLTQADVNYIRSVYKPRDKEYSTVALSKKFGVHRKTISRITTGQYWR